MNFIQSPVERPLRSALINIKKALKSGNYRFNSQGELEKRCAKCAEVLEKVDGVPPSEDDVFWPADSEFFPIREKKHKNVFGGRCIACYDIYRNKG